MSVSVFTILFLMTCAELTIAKHVSFSEDEEEGGPGIYRRDRTESDEDEELYLGSQGLGPNPSCCDKCCARFYPSGFTRELTAMFKIGWPIVSTEFRRRVFGLTGWDPELWSGQDLEPKSGI